MSTPPFDCAQSEEKHRDPDNPAHPQASATIHRFQRVGFQLNTIGVLSGKYDGTEDDTPTDYKVQVNWGDGPSWTSAHVLAEANKATDSKLVLLGSHTYSSIGSFPIVVDVTGPDGIATAVQTCSGIVSGMPSKLQGATPPVFAGSKAPTYVTLTPSSVASISLKVGQSFSSMPIAVLNGQYDGATDTSTGDYHARPTTAIPPSGPPRPSRAHPRGATR